VRITDSYTSFTTVLLLRVLVPRRGLLRRVLGPRVLGSRPRVLVPNAAVSARRLGWQKRPNSKVDFDGIGDWAFWGRGRGI